MTDVESAGSLQPGDAGVGRVTPKVITHWPSLVGVGVVVVLAVIGLQTHMTAMIIMMAALSVLLTAALGRPGAAWFVLPAIGGVAALGMATSLDAIVLLLVLAAMGVAFGLLRLPRRTWGSLLLEFAAFVVVAVLALGAMMITPIAATILVGVVALAHGSWCAARLRRRNIVPRVYAELLAVVEFGLAIVTLIMAISGW